MKLDEETRKWGDQWPYGDDGAARIQIVFVVGTYSDRPSVGGVQIDGAAFVFDTRSDLAMAIPPDVPNTRDAVDRAIVIHEIGHVLGLVDNGLPMVKKHNDPNSPLHSKNSESVMYASVDTLGAQSSVLLPQEAPPYQFDADDLADIRYAQSLEPKPR